MAKKPTESQISIRFGGGLHTRASEEDIHKLECSDGINFDLDPPKT